MLCNCSHIFLQFFSYKDIYFLGSHTICPHASMDYLTLFPDPIYRCHWNKTIKKGSLSELNVISKGLHFSGLLSFRKNSNRNENIILSSKLKIFECSRTKCHFCHTVFHPLNLTLGVLSQVSQSYFVSTWAISTGSNIYWSRKEQDWSLSTDGFSFYAAQR